MDPVNIETQVKPVLTPQGHMDPDFTASVASPSPVYTDFFGIQALADTTQAEILRDFVPAYADVANKDPHSLTLRFKGGYTARFFPHSAILLRTSTLPFDHVYISGSTWRERQANVRAFRGLLRHAGLAHRYLIPNPSYEAEKAVARWMVTATPAKVTADPTLTIFEQRPDAVLLLPEHVHGNDADYQKLAAALDHHRIDWLALEALPTNMQPTLDAFSRAPQGSAVYLKARAALITYFADFWNGRDGPKTTGEQNYYFKLAELARHHHARLVGLEGVLSGPPLAYSIFRYGETEFGVATRDWG
ncbi:MAG: hypothetical protein ACREQD_11690, partial [Candidatus Binataceae bacterium]